MALPGIDVGTRGVAIAGPTASGKSRLALEIARAHDGVVINADAMQVYDGLRILTARPGAADEAAVPHRLYGVFDPARSCSAAAWAELANAEIAAARAAGRLPVLVGGTGLYFRALFEGLAAIPPIPADIRDALRARAEPAEALHAELARRDPMMAGRLGKSDRQRILRALEVLEATGRSIATFQDEASSPLEPPEGWLRIVLNLDRAVLLERIDQRFHSMIAAGALAEAARFAGRGLPADVPAMKAIGVPELMAAASGAISEAEAIAAAIQATRRYAKRQATWFRTQMPDWVAMAV